MFIRLSKIKTIEFFHGVLQKNVTAATALPQTSICRSVTTVAIYEEFGD
jgi:hypothetical protein